MPLDQLFIDTTYVQARLNRADQYHRRAGYLAPRLQAAEVWIIEAVLVEVGNALSAYNRAAAVAFIEQAYRSPRMHVVPVDTALLQRAARLYRDRADKTWGLTDCISFVVMTENGLTEAVTADWHFVQAGFRASLLETRD